MKKHLQKIGVYVFKTLVRKGSLVAKNGHIQNGDMYRYRLEFKDVCYISSTGNPLTKNYVVFHTVNNTRMYQRNTIKCIMDSADCFVAISKSVAINIERILYTTPKFSAVFMATSTEPKKLKVSEHYQSKLRTVLKQNYLI